MSIADGLRAAAVLNDAQLQLAYRQAVARGVRNTCCRSEQERAYGTLRLLTLALLRLPDLALYAHLAHACDELDGAVDDGHDEALLLQTTVCDVAAGTLRLTHRALETHGDALGYELGACLERARRQAREQLQRPDDALELPVGVEQARHTTVALTRATAASGDDPMLFCEQLSRSLGHLLVIYAATREAGG